MGLRGREEPLGLRERTAPMGVTDATDATARAGRLGRLDQVDRADQKASVAHKDPQGHRAWREHVDLLVQTALGGPQGQEGTGVRQARKGRLDLRGEAHLLRQHQPKRRRRRVRQWLGRRRSSRLG